MVKPFSMDLLIDEKSGLGAAGARHDEAAPQAVQLALDPNEDLVQMPFVTRAWPMPAQTPREARVQRRTPPPNALEGDDHAALSQDQLDIPKARAANVVEFDRVADQIGRKVIKIVRVRRFSYTDILTQADTVRKLS